MYIAKWVQFPSYLLLANWLGYIKYYNLIQGEKRMSKTTEKKKRTNVNTVSIVGTLAEVGNLKKFRVDKEGKEVADDAKNDDVVIKAADFKKPAFVIDVNGQKIGVKTFPVSMNKKADKFKAMETIMGYEVGTRVKIGGMITVGDPYPTKSGNVFESVDVTMYSLSTSNVPDEDYAIGEVSGYVKGVKPEVEGEDDDETGRMIIDFWLYNEYNDDKSLKPFTLISTVDNAEACEDEFGDGGNAVIQFDIISKRVGGTVKKSSGGFGSKSAKLTSGYTKIEYVPFYGKLFDDDDEEYSDFYVDEDVIKKLLKAHKQKCEEAKNGATSKEDDTPKKGLGSAKRKIEVDDDEDDECPFD